MAHGDKDARVGSGHVIYGSVRRPTNAIWCDCMCFWSVIRPGPGMECVSELRYRNSLCPRARQHDEDAASAVPMPDILRMVSGDD
jgi:hypothetical protein